MQLSSPKILDYTKAYEEEEELSENLLTKVEKKSSILTFTSISLEILPIDDYHKNTFYYNLFYSSVSGSIFCLLCLSFGCGKNSF